MFKLIIIFSLLSITFIGKAQSDIFKSHQGVNTSGDIAQVALPVGGYFSSFFWGDKEGQMMFYKSFIVNTALTHSLKYLINKPRPENNGDYSFPSGHTAAAFHGAAFIERRYGWKWGAPCYAIASYVGYTRIKSGMHDIWDCLGGAILGISTSYYFTDKDNDQSLISGFVSQNGTYGISFTVNF